DSYSRRIKGSISGYMTFDATKNTGQKTSKAGIFVFSASLSCVRVFSMEFSHFLSIARGSLNELETQITLATDLGFMKADENLTALISRLFKLLHGLQRKLQV
ncbi:MAG: four helix bundle protein, partial [Bacillota bacterium]|nr:four helix bundle protein [Bacillota bacterium]